MRRLLIASILVWLVAPLGATVVVPIEFREIVGDAGLIVRGIVTDVRVVSTPEGVETVATVAIDRVLKGEAGQFVSVRVPGGVSGQYRHVMIGAPALQTGQRAVFFLTRQTDFGWRPVGLSAGIARIVADAATRRAVVRAPVLAGATAAAGTVIRGDRKRRSLSVDEFESLVRVVMAPRAAVRRPQ